MSVWSLTTWSILLTFFHKIRLFDRIEIFSAAAWLTALWVRSKEEGHQLKYCNMPVDRMRIIRKFFIFTFSWWPHFKIYFMCSLHFFEVYIQLHFSAHWSGIWSGIWSPTILLYFTRIRGAFRKSGGEAIGYNSLTINIIDTF